MRDYEIRLIGQDSDSGEILFEDLDRIGTAVKDIVYRLTREAASRGGLGRAPAVIESLSNVRIGLAPGSTRLLFRIGDRDALAVDPLSTTVDQLFWDIVQGMSVNKRAPVPDTVADAVADLARALRRAAVEAEFRVGAHAPLRLRTSELHGDVWTSTLPLASDEATVHGILEMVDLKTARFRLVDAAGNSVDLIDVLAPAEAAGLIGHHVSAIGLLSMGSGSQHHRMMRPTVSAVVSVSERLGVGDRHSLARLVSDAHGLGEPKRMDLSDAEIDEFLAAVRA